MGQYHITNLLHLHEELYAELLAPQDTPAGHGTPGSHARARTGVSLVNPEKKRKLFFILAAVLMALGLILCAEYLGFFRMVDFYLYEDYE